VPPEPGQEYRHIDALDSLWNMLDLTPAGRGDFQPQLSYTAINARQMGSINFHVARASVRKPI
jgi:predicted dithiol-disulfide oxidoreductase (DUF899 family)